MAEDYYSILGVAKDADSAAIKSAYRKLARLWHPDAAANEAKEKLRGLGKYTTDSELNLALKKYQETAEFKALSAKYDEKFKAINNAYGILSDPDKRAAYNLYGTSGFHFNGNDDVFAQERKEIERLLSETRTNSRKFLKLLRPDFTKKNWKFLDVSNLDVSAAIFSSRVAPQEIFSSTHHFEGANLEHAIFDHARIGDSYVLESAKSINHASFKNAFFQFFSAPKTISNVDFSNARFGNGSDRFYPTTKGNINHRLESCNLSNAQFNQRFGRDAHFVGCNLTGADLRGMDMGNAPRFTDCNLHGITIQESALPHIKEQRPRNAIIKVVPLARDTAFKEVHFNEHGIQVPPLRIRPETHARPTQRATYEPPPPRRPQFTSPPKAAKSFGEHFPGGKNGLMMAGAALVVGGVIAAVSVAENKDAERHKLYKRPSLPHPTGDWQSRINQPSVTQGTLLY